MIVIIYYLNVLIKFFNFPYSHPCLSSRPGQKLLERDEMGKKVGLDDFGGQFALVNQYRPDGDSLRNGSTEKLAEVDNIGKKLRFDDTVLDSIHVNEKGSD